VHEEFFSRKISVPFLGGAPSFRPFPAIFLYNADMISRISGTLLDLDLKTAIIDVSGIGYKVFVGGETLESLAGNVGQTVSLFTYLAVRENALDLYGFKNQDTLEMFELLITVSGIGPKSALGILSIASAHTIRDAIISEDTSYLTKVSGIGKKNAEKIVLELKGKFKDGDYGIETGKDVTKEALAVEALKSLGFEEKEAREAVKSMDKELSVEAMIKSALKDIGLRK
jgi:Holliday junction DNA helicase RuvA